MPSFLNRQADRPASDTTKREHHLSGAMMMDSNPDTTPRRGLLGSLLRRGSLIRKKPKVSQTTQYPASEILLEHCAF